MKPARFEYVAVGSVEEAVEALGAWGGEAKVLAGGQSLVPLMNLRLARPRVLGDINGVRGLEYVRAEDGVLRIGALARHRAVEESVVVGQRWPILRAGAKQVGHLAIRNRGTFGGSVAHADPAAEWPQLGLGRAARGNPRVPVV